jgi:hypothetical protein
MDDAARRVLSIASQCSSSLDISESKHHRIHLVTYAPYGVDKDNHVFLLCSVDQARSLASYDHNADQFFQYFSIDFGKDAIVGGHGKAILDHAVFVNDALASMKSLYSDGKLARS